MGSTIKIYLQEDLPTGIRKLELLGWTGVALAFPQSSLADVMAKYKSLQDQPGVYILCWRDEDRVIQKVYIGESNGVLWRVKEHTQTKSGAGKKEDLEWADAVLFYTSDTILNAAHVEEIEAILLKLVRAAKRVDVPQTQQPSEKLQSDSDIDYVADFIDKIGLILPLADVDILAPRTEKKGAPGTDEITATSKRFKLKGPDSEASAEIVGDQWVVLLGSVGRVKETPSFAAMPNAKIRHKLIEEGVLVLEGDRYKFTVDRAFKSPSQAAEIVLGRSANGRLEWKHSKTGQTFDDWENEQITLASDAGMQ